MPLPPLHELEPEPPPKLLALVPLNVATALVASNVEKRKVLRSIFEMLDYFRWEMDD
jgi:hypothetical protein